MSVVLLVLLSACAHGAPAAETHPSFACLPKDVLLADPVTPDASDPSSRIQPRTVEQALVDLKARCRKGKLMAAGREVRFIRLQGCWGNPPDDYREILRAQAEEIERARAKYTVITIPCATGDLRRISHSSPEPPRAATGAVR